VILASVALFVTSQVIPQAVDLGHPRFVGEGYGWPNVAHVTIAGPPEPSDPGDRWVIREIEAKTSAPRPSAFRANLLCFIPFASACAFTVDWWLRRRFYLIHVLWLVASAGVVFAFWAPDIAEQRGPFAPFWTLFGVAVLAARICAVFWAGCLVGWVVREAWRLDVELRDLAVADAATWRLRAVCHGAINATTARSHVSPPQSEVREEAP
jgi:hypothetical protein